MKNKLNRRDFISAASVVGVGLAIGLPTVASASGGQLAKPAILGGPKAFTGNMKYLATIIITFMVLSSTSYAQKSEPRWVMESKAVDKIVMTNPDAPHDFPPAAREATDAFLDKELKFQKSRKESANSPDKNLSAKKKSSWQVGFGRRVITPQNNDVWLAGYDGKRVAVDKIHDLWVKVMALKGPDGKRVVMATTDHMGMSKTVYESIYLKVNQRFKIDRSEFMLTFSHNHCGPCLRDDLVDYYPSDDEQRNAVGEYTDWMESQVIDAISDALANWQPAKLFIGEGNCTFAVNRRENPEEEVPKLIEAGIPFKGVVDHYVPVLAVKRDRKSVV